MVPSFLDKQTADCDSPYDWLMSLDMNLAALCDMWSEDVAFSCHFMALHLLPTFPPYSSACGIGYTCKNYLKWQAIQLVIQCTVDTVNYF